MLIHCNCSAASAHREHGKPCRGQQHAGCEHLGHHAPVLPSQLPDGVAAVIHCLSGNIHVLVWILGQLPVAPAVHPGLRLEMPCSKGWGACLHALLVSRESHPSGDMLRHQHRIGRIAKLTSFGPSPCPCPCCCLCPGTRRPPSPCHPPVHERKEALLHCHVQICN